MKHGFLILPIILASPAMAEDTRQLDAHEHGVGALNIAIDGNAIAMEFRAPGADIVGFEYTAKSAEDRAAVDAAVAVLARPLDLFVVPAAAECTVTRASAQLEADEHHEDHAEDAHAHDDHAHDEHAHDEHGHEDHAESEQHAEFHAEYALTCGDPEALSEIAFAYFETFENARELEVQIVSSSGAQSFEVHRDDPRLDLRGMF